MSIGAVNSISLHSVSFGKSLKSFSSKNEVQAANQSPLKELSSIPTSKVLSQMGNVSFTSHYNYGQDDFSPWSDWVRNNPGANPPMEEVAKYRASRQAQEYIDNEDYLSAIRVKLNIARRCYGHDAFLLEESVRRLYRDLPKYQKAEAREMIADYNSDMAKYIEEDIKKMSETNYDD